MRRRHRDFWGLYSLDGATALVGSLNFHPGLGWISMVHPFKIVMKGPACMGCIFFRMCWDSGCFFCVGCFYGRIPWQHITPFRRETNTIYRGLIAVVTQLTNDSSSLLFSPPSGARWAPWTKDGTVGRGREFTQELPKVCSLFDAFLFFICPQSCDNGQYLPGTCHVYSVVFFHANWLDKGRCFCRSMYSKIGSYWETKNPWVDDPLSDGRMHSNESNEWDEMKQHEISNETTWQFNEI